MQVLAVGTEYFRSSEHRLPSDTFPPMTKTGAGGSTRYGNPAAFTVFDAAYAAAAGPRPKRTVARRQAIDEQNRASSTNNNTGMGRPPVRRGSQPEVGPQ